MADLSAHGDGEARTGAAGPPGARQRRNGFGGDA